MDRIAGSKNTFLSNSKLGRSYGKPTTWEDNFKDKFQKIFIGFIFYLFKILNFYIYFLKDNDYYFLKLLKI